MTPSRPIVNRGSLFQRLLRRSVALAFLISAVVTLIQTAAWGTTADARSARVAFQRVFWKNDGSTGHIAIFTARPDGSGVRQLTHPPSGVETGRVDWSPDGRWIVYIRGTAAHDPRRFHIFRMRRNGMRREDLSDGHCPQISCDGEEDPTWSPGGGHIAFIRVVDGMHHVYVMRSDGTHRRMVVAAAGGGRFMDLAPEWSPNGGRLVFAREDLEREVLALFTVRVDGSGLQRITQWALAGGSRPDWSSDGRWIVFSKESSSGSTQLFMVHPDGEGIRKVTHTPHYDWAWAGFRPNGRGITAVRIPGRRSENDVYVMRLDGSHLRNVTKALSRRPAEGLPDWGSAS
jgi:TolB protein